VRALRRGRHGEPAEQLAQLAVRRVEEILADVLEEVQVEHRWMWPWKG
jgi:hypothetical protein